MKQYIQPESVAVAFHVENTIMATSIQINKEAAQSDALNNKKEDMWGHKTIWE